MTKKELNKLAKEELESLAELRETIKGFIVKDYITNSKVLFDDNVDDFGKVKEMINSNNSGIVNLAHELSTYVKEHARSSFYENIKIPSEYLTYFLEQYNVELRLNIIYTNMVVDYDYSKIYSVGLPCDYLKNRYYSLVLQYNIFLHCNNDNMEDILTYLLYHLDLEAEAKSCMTHYFNKVESNDITSYPTKLNFNIEETPYRNINYCLDVLDSLMLKEIIISDYDKIYEEYKSVEDKKLYVTTLPMFNEIVTLHSMAEILFVGDTNFDEETKNKIRLLLFDKTSVNFKTYLDSVKYFFYKVNNYTMKYFMMYFNLIEAMAYKKMLEDRNEDKSIEDYGEEE